MALQPASLLSIETGLSLELNESLSFSRRQRYTTFKNRGIKLCAENI